MMINNIKFSIYRKIILLLCVSLLFISCSFKVNQDVKVHIIAIGVSYLNNQEGVSYLAATPIDAAEFGTYYKCVLDSKQIDNDLYLMLDYGNKTSGYTEDYTNRSSSLVPTVNNLNSLLDKLRNTVKPEDLLVFFYSGHGFGGNIATTAPENGGLVLLKDAEGIQKQEYNLPSLVEKLRGINCTKTIFLDSCFSGSIGGAIGSDGSEGFTGDSAQEIGLETVLSQSFNELVKVKDIVAIAGSRANEMSWQISSKDFNNEAHGVFTGYMLNKMGLTHSDNVFYVLPTSSDQSDNVHTSLSTALNVCGDLPHNISSWSFSTNDIYEYVYSHIKLISFDVGGIKYNQHLTKSMSPCSVLLAW